MKICGACGHQHWISNPDQSKDWKCHCGNILREKAVRYEAITSGCKLTPKKIVPYEGYED